MAEARTTPRGSPCARSWTADWVAVVEAEEESLGRAICGARLMSGNACTLVSTHDSGRCRYHGGFDLTGAPEGNRNAVLHNLYSRRLMPCGPHCPVWKSCPLTFSLTERKSKQKESVTGPSVRKSSASNQAATATTPRASAATASFGSTFSSPEEKVESRFIPSGYAQEILKLNPVDRPVCPYEQTEYNAAVSDAMQQITQKRSLAYARHIVHQLALAQVMVTRAGLALREAEFTKPTVVTGENYHMTTPKIAPALTAYEKLERAWLRLLTHFDRHYANYRDRDYEEAAYNRRIQSDTVIDPDAQTQHYEAMDAPPPRQPYRPKPANNREGEAPGESDAHAEAHGSAGASPSQHNTASAARQTGGPSSVLAAPAAGLEPIHADAPGTPPAITDSSAESASQISLGQRPRADGTQPIASPEGAKQSPTDVAPDLDPGPSTEEERDPPSEEALAVAVRRERLFADAAAVVRGGVSEHDGPRQGGRDVGAGAEGDIVFET